MSEDNSEKADHVNDMEKDNSEFYELESSVDAYEVGGGNAPKEHADHAKREVIFDDIPKDLRESFDPIVL